MHPARPRCESFNCLDMPAKEPVVFSGHFRAFAGRAPQHVKNANLLLCESCFYKRRFAVFSITNHTIRNLREKAYTTIFISATITLN